MGLKITITDIATLTVQERAILSFVLDDAALMREDIDDLIEKDAIQRLHAEQEVSRAMRPNSTIPIAPVASAARTCVGCAYHCERTEENDYRDCSGQECRPTYAAPVAPSPAAPSPAIPTLGEMHAVVAQVFTPAPPPPPVAPAAPVAPAPNAELDKRGLPWDLRIHSREHTKNQDGSWRDKRGLDPVTLAEVEAELRNVMAIPAVATTGTMRAAGGAGGSMEMPGEGVIGPTLCVIPTPPAAPVTPPAAPAAPVVTSSSPFAAFMQRITPLIKDGKLTQPIIVETVQKHSLPNLMLLSSRPDLIPQVLADLLAAAGVAE